MDANVIKSLKEVRTPIAFLSLMIVMIEGALLFFGQKAEGTDFTIIVVGVIVLPFVCLLVLYLMYRNKVVESCGLPVHENIKVEHSGKQYDLFVSAPMAAFDTEEEYKSSRESIFSMVRGIKKHCKFESVFYAGEEISSFKEFDSEDLSITKDYEAVCNSKYFLLIYPQKIASSALIELGWAMVLNKRIIIFVKSHKDLPYLLNQADSVYRNLSIYKYKTSSDVVDKFKNSGDELFCHFDKP